MARRTPLYEAHRALGGRLVEFAGWEMPLSYRGIAEEHQAVRRHCGLFDVSHMGEIEVRGPSAAAVCQEVTVNDVRRLGIGDAQYTLLCNEAGGVLDDLVLYRLGAGSPRGSARATPCGSRPGCRSAAPTWTPPRRRSRRASRGSSSSTRASSSAARPWRRRRHRG